VKAGDIILPGMSVEVKVRTAAALPGFLTHLPPVLRAILPQ